MPFIYPQYNDFLTKIPWFGNMIPKPHSMHIAYACKICVSP